MSGPERGARGVGGVFAPTAAPVALTPPLSLSLAREANAALVQGSVPRAVVVNRAVLTQEELRLQRKREQLMVLARRLAGVLQ